MKWCALVLELHLPRNFCHTHRHFPEIVKSYSGHPKTCKSIKNRKSKNCTQTILSSTYIEESKKRKKRKMNSHFKMYIFTILDNDKSNSMHLFAQIVFYYFSNAHEVPITFCRVAWDFLNHFLSLFKKLEINSFLYILFGCNGNTFIVINIFLKLHKF